MTATFDYENFAKNLTKQAEDVLPEDIALQHKKEFLDRIYNFTYIAGEAFSNDECIENSDPAKFLTQVISEWIFHKYVDLLRSDIPAIYHESILQKLGFVAYEMGRESAVGKLSKDELLKLVEVQLKKSFEKACSHLLLNGQITQDVYDNAMKLSNIDYMKVENKVVGFRTFNYTLTALCLALLTLGANVFMYDFQYLDIVNTVALIVLSMYMGFYIGVKKFAR